MSTYLSLTNQLLRRLNEVEISQADFLVTRGVQSVAKDAIRSSIAHINRAEFEWPFNAAIHSAQLIVGQEEYSWPQYFKVVDWNSFQIQKDDTLGVSNKHLSHISRDAYYKDYKDSDDDAGAVGVSCPTFVFEGHGNGYGVSPSPDKTYALKFRYFLNYTDLILHDDATRIPNTYDPVIVEGALYYMYSFRDNLEAAGLALSIFQQGIKEMQSILINKYDSIRDTRVERVVRVIRSVA